MAQQQRFQWHREGESQVWSLGVALWCEALENEGTSHLLEGDLGQRNIKMKKLKDVNKLLGKMQMRQGVEFLHRGNAHGKREVARPGAEVVGSAFPKKRRPTEGGKQRVSFDGNTFV